jgi:hypothetical protein
LEKQVKMKPWETVLRRLASGLALSAACIALLTTAPAQAFDFDID